MNEAQMLDRLATLLEPVKYRDVTFGVQAEPIYPSVSVTYLRQVQDVNHVGWTVPFGGVVRVPPTLLTKGLERHFYDWLFRFVVMDIEHHEAAEHFLVSGIRMFDPHREAV